MSNAVLHIRVDVHSLCIRLSEAADGAVFTVHAALAAIAAARQETEINFST
jgi:hypothetical protein